jgi:uncharacterized cupin superfamily protein
MPTIFKPEELEFNRDKFNSDHFNLLTILPNLCKKVDAKHFVFDIRRLNPGCYSFPYHYHRNAEELMMIISGSMAIRTPKGFQILQQGEIVFMEMGESGAHQFYNHTEAPCSYLDVKSFKGLDIVEYLDSGKIRISPYNEVFYKNSQVEYLKGEDNYKGAWKDFNPPPSNGAAPL